MKLSLTVAIEKWLDGKTLESHSEIPLGLQTKNSNSFGPESNPVHWYVKHWNLNKNQELSDSWFNFFKSVEYRISKCIDRRVF